MDDKDKNGTANPWQAYWPGYGYGPAAAPPPPGGQAPGYGAGPYGPPPPYWPGYGHPPYHGHPGWAPPPGANATGGGFLSGLNLQNDAFLKGLLIGAGASLLLSNETVQKNTIATLVKLWAGVQGSVEEMKERFRDIEAELQAQAEEEEG
jgi:hypothetical protein